VRSAFGRLSSIIATRGRGDDGVINVYVEDNRIEVPR
jgi:hypothetical protein